MKIKVRHETTYTYDKPVWLQPHVFRMQPRTDGTVRLLDHKIQLDPNPVQLSRCLDAEGNTVVHAWFRGTAERLNVVSEFEAELLRNDPFDYILGPVAQELPIRYPDALEPVLCGYLERESEDIAVTDFAREIAAEAGSRTLDFLTALTQRIHKQFPRIIREHGRPHAPEEMLRLKTGSCRDVAVLFLETCRVAGIAARFVSGYQKGDPNRRARRYMHAWAEVYLPGGGWRGYDPTNGAPTADHHVAVAASRQPAAASPIEGAFQGHEVRSKMEAHVEIH